MRKIALCWFTNRYKKLKLLSSNYKINVIEILLFYIYIYIKLLAAHDIGQLKSYLNFTTIIHFSQKHKRRRRRKCHELYYSWNHFGNLQWKPSDACFSIDDVLLNTNKEWHGISCNTEKWGNILLLNHCSPYQDCELLY